MMAGNIATLIGSGVTVVAIAVGVVIINIFMRNVKKDIKELLDRQFVSCNSRMGKIEKVDDEQWSALHSHGHSGLSGDNAKVTV